ncbi:MAG TPA: sigma-70 family RNA polymerase sigma factor, partial [Acidimicrobiia bacterium]|nr:sigma-70 family RNA polymerase sigma factor [Acidimicrobiia bacterium]
DPEDLVQDVFVAAVEQLPGFVGDRSGLRSLLFTIAYRRIADEHRRFYRRPEILVAEPRATSTEGPTVEELIARGESAGQALQALEVLNDRERKVIEMRILEEVPPAKVGRALGLSTGNVRVIQARALTKIRTHLTSIGEGGFAQPIFTVGTLTGSVRYLRTEVPSDDVLGPWVEELRSVWSAPIRNETASVGGTTAAHGSVAATERLTETTYSILSTAISSGAARIGAVVSVVALSTAPLVPAVVTASSASSSDRTDPVVEVRDETPTTPDELAGFTPGEGVESGHDRPASSNPTILPPAAGEGPERSDASFEEGAVSEIGPAGVGPTEITAEPLNPVDDLVEPLVEDTVGLLVDDVVTPLVLEVVEPLVEEVVEPLVEDTLDLVVEDVAQPLVDEVVDPLLEDAVQPQVDGLTGTLEDAVGGLLGGN